MSHDDTTPEPVAPPRALEKFYSIGSRHYFARYEVVGEYCARFWAWDLESVGALIRRAMDENSGQRGVGVMTGPGRPAVDDALVRGEVKWDGCTNHELPQKDVMRHACDREGLANFGILMGRIYDQATAIMPSHIIDDAEPVVEDGPFPWEAP